MVSIEKVGMFDYTCYFIKHMNNVFHEYAQNLSTILCGSEAFVMLSIYLWKFYQKTDWHRKSRDYKYNFHASITMIRFETDRQQEKWYYRTLGRSLTAGQADLLYAFKKAHDLYSSQIAFAIDHFDFTENKVEIKNARMIGIRYYGSLIILGISLLLACVYTVLLLLFFHSVIIWNNGYIPYIFCVCVMWIFPLICLYTARDVIVAHGIVKKINAPK